MFMPMCPWKLQQEPTPLSPPTFWKALRSDASKVIYHNPQQILFRRKAVVLLATPNIPWALSYSQVRSERRRPDDGLLPCLSSSSSSTLNAENFLGSTPCSPRIWMLALENPHCGVSGVPFMNSTTGLEATALSMAARVSVDSSRRWNGERRIGGKELGQRRNA